LEKYTVAQIHVGEKPHGRLLQRRSFTAAFLQRAAGRYSPISRSREAPA